MSLTLADACARELCPEGGKPEDMIAKIFLSSVKNDCPKIENE